MANEVQVVHKTGSVSIDKLVTQQLKLGWALYGSPFELQGNAAQILVKGTEEAADETGTYRVIQKSVGSSMESQITALVKSGWELYGDPFDVYGLPAQAMVNGFVPIQHGAGDSGGNTPGSDGALKVLLVPGTPATFSITEAHRNTLLIFSSGAVTVQLGTGIPVSLDDAFTAMAVNKSGTIALQGENIVSYTDHADKNVTVGLIRINGGWVVTGTNVPLDTV